MAEASTVKLPEFKFDDKDKDFRILLIIDELKTKFVTNKPVDGITVEEPRYTDKSVGVKVTIDKTKKSNKLVYIFNLNLPETIIPGESRFKILGDHKLELKVRKEVERPWESYIDSLMPSVEDTSQN